MAHRNFSFTSSISEMDRDQFQNGFNPEHRLPLENGSFALPMDNVAVNGSNYIPYLNVPLRSNDYPSSSVEIPHYRSTTSGSTVLHQQHLSTGSSSSFMPSAYAQQGPCYNHYMMPSDEGRNLNPQVENGRGSIKRKSPSMFSDTANTSWYHNGSSSDISVSADCPQQKPWHSSHQWYWDPNGSVHNYNGSSLLVSGESSQRNVRSRHIHTPHLDANSAVTHFSSNLPCHFPQVGDFHGPVMNGQWCHNPMYSVSHGRTPSGASGCSHINQSFVSSNSSVSVEPNGSHHNNVIPSRHLGAPLPTIPGPSQSTSEGQNNSRQRIGPSHRSMTCYPSSLFTTTSQEAGQSGSAAFSRHSRPLSISGGHNAERNGRPRFSYGRYQPYSDDNSGHGRWMSEGVLMMDQSTYYDSSNLYDQHLDMRLDIDNMSYEELLALEERIGNVNTGLSEDIMPKCLTKTIFCSSDQMQDLDEGSCVICLECYRDKDELGTLKCGHDYHADCIKKWLLMKNVCPICKASALEDPAKE